MKYAITFENNQVFQHFGKTPLFMMVDVIDGVAQENIIPTDGKGHGALVGFLKEYQVDVLVCGGIGQGARDALTASNIALISGAKGNIKDIISSILDGSLKDDPSGMCNHHHEGEHNCGSHDCTK